MTQDRTGTAPGQEIPAAIAARELRTPCKPVFSTIYLFQALETASRLYARDSRHFSHVRTSRDRTGTAPHQAIGAEA